MAAQQTPFAVADGYRESVDAISAIVASLTSSLSEGAPLGVSSMYVANDMTVTNNLKVGDTQTIDGDLVVKGESTLKGKVRCKDQLVVTEVGYFHDRLVSKYEGNSKAISTIGDVSFGADLKVEGTVEATNITTSDLSVEGTLNITDFSVPDITVTGDATLQGDASVAGIAKLGSVDVTGDSLLQGDLAVTGNSELNSVTVTGESSLQGGVTVTGESSLQGGVTIANNADLTVTGDTALQGDLVVTGDSSLKGDASVDGNIDIGGNVSATSDISTGGNTTIGTVTDATSTTPATATGTLRVYDDIIVGANDSTGEYISGSGNITALGTISVSGRIISSYISQLNDSNTNLFARIGLVEGYYCQNFNRPDIEQGQIRSLPLSGSYAIFATQMPSGANPSNGSGLLAGSWMSTFTLSTSVNGAATPAFTFVQVGTPAFGQELTINYLEAQNSTTDGINNGPNQDNIVFMGFASGNTPGASTYNIIANAYNKSVGAGGGQTAVTGTAIMFAGYEETPFLSSNGSPYGGGTAGQDTPYRWIPTCCVPFAPGTARKFVYMSYSKSTTYPDGSLFPLSMPSTDFLFQGQGIGASSIEYAYSGKTDGSGELDVLPQQSQYRDGGAWVEVTTAPTNVFPNIFTNP